jgi:hypothetical protein
MRKSLLLFVLFLVCPCLFPAANANAQSTLIPAGTLLHCTIDDPTISPKTAQVGDPVLCHLNQFTEFGHAAFPRGSYLAGHLEAAKQPGHFIGKGYLDIVFDHIGLPNTDADLNARLVAAQGQKVDKEGDIMGHGHAKRDLIEWAIPPLWPWKIITLPARGPQPKLKTEQMITLKVLQDVELPRLTAYLLASPNVAPRSQSYSQPYAQPSSGPVAPRSSSGVYYLLPTMPAAAPPASLGPAQVADMPSRVLTLVALKSDTIVPASDYWVAGRELFYVLPDGSEASTDLNRIDWQRTTDLNAERGVRVTLRTTPMQPTQF